MLATYYQTLGFQSPVLLTSLHSHTAVVGLDPYAASATTGDNTHFTRLDATVDFDIGRAPMLSALIPTPISTFPTQYFSVWWRGFLKAPSSSLYRLHI